MSLHLRSFSCDGPCRHYYFEHGLYITEFSSSIHHREHKLPSNLEDCSIGSTSAPSMADHDATDSPQNNGGIFEKSHSAYIPHGPSGNLIAFSEQFSTCVKKGVGPPVTTTTFMVHHYPHTKMDNFIFPQMLLPFLPKEVFIRSNNPGFLVTSAELPMPPGLEEADADDESSTASSAPPKMNFPLPRLLARC
jgi:hypothetical protein